MAIVDGGWGVCDCDLGAAQTAQFWAMRIISVASRHPNDVHFVPDGERTVLAL